jgi:preprotein translocase subunit SecB
MTNGNGAPPEAAPPPQLNVLAQYTKDLSFENPNAPSSLAPLQQQPAINIQINVSANNIAENEYEVTLSVEGKAENAGKLMFSFDLAYAGVFRIVNVPKENLHPLVMIECPRLLFPFAREIIATSVRDGGFPPLMLDPVDFVGLYRQNLERRPPHRRHRSSRADAAPRKSFQIGLSPSVAIKARCARRSSRSPGAWRATCAAPRRLTVSVDADITGFAGQDLRLPRDQVDIDFGQQFGVEQCAVLGAAGIVDRITRAKIIETVRDAGMLAPRQQQRVDQPFPRNRRPFDALKLGVEEGDIKRRVVDHQRRVANEFQELLDHMSEQRLVGEELAGKTVHGICFSRHFALGIEMPVKGLAGRHAIENLDTADLNQPIAA